MSEEMSSGNLLVRVRAQVMTRDDSTGGWVPMGGGGLSYVFISKEQAHCEPGESEYEYQICGRRISDQSVVLSCIIRTDFEYNKVTPTFHHWRTGGQKFGLTFQTAADARAFDKGLRTAVDEFLDGIAGPSAENIEVTEDEVFMALKLPFEGQTSRSSSDSSNRGSKPVTSTSSAPPPATTSASASASVPTPALVPAPVLTPARIPTSNPAPSQEQVFQRSHHFFDIENIDSEHESTSSHTDNYPYVHLANVREYLYPDIESSAVAHYEASGSFKHRSFESLSPAMARLRSRELGKDIPQRCCYCHELYVESENRRGACELAPDAVKTAIDEITCARCARCMLYHCMAEEEGDFERHPCECDRAIVCSRRWREFVSIDEDLLRQYMYYL